MRAAWLLALLLLPAPLEAGGTRQRSIQTFEDFSQGEVEGLAIRESGSLVPGRSREVLAGFGRGVWSAVPAANGSFLVSTSEPATIQLLQGSKAKLLHTDPKALSFVLAAAPSGIVYAGVLNSGQLLKVDGRGTVAPFASLPAGAIWSVACDAQGHLFAATGPKGVLYRVDPQGKVETWFNSDELNLLSVATAADGSVFAGGGERGNVYRISGPGKGEVWRHFSAGAEVRALVAAGGVVYAAVNSQPEGQTGQQGPHAHGKSEQGGGGAELPQPPAEEEQAAGPGAPPDAPAEEAVGDGEEGGGAQDELQGSLWAIDAERRGELLTELENEFILGLEREADGGLLLGTGPHGRLYRVEPGTGERLTLHQVSQTHVVSLAVRDGRLALAGTGDAGTVVLSGPPTPNGTWTSPVFDAGSRVDFGALRAHATGVAHIFSRSGNDPAPGPFWSAWAGPVLPPGGPNGCPPGRYLQLRVQLAPSPVPASLEDLQFFYAGVNHRPRVESLAVTKEETFSATVAADPAKPVPAEEAKPQPGQKPVASSRVRIQWSAADADEDALVFRLQYRDTAFGPQSPWLPLDGGEPIDAEEYTWDTGYVPDGRYIVRVVASDERSNPPSESLTGERSSEALVVDNSRPEVRELAVKDGRVQGVAHDRASYVESLAMSVDGSAWVPVPAADGIFDSTSERFAFEVPELEPGAHVIAVQALDGQGNAGTAHVLVTR